MVTPAGYFAAKRALDAGPQTLRQSLQRPIAGRRTVEQWDEERQEWVKVARETEVALGPIGAAVVGLAVLGVAGAVVAGAREAAARKQAQVDAGNASASGIVAGAEAGAQGGLA